MLENGVMIVNSSEHCWNVLFVREIIHEYCQNMRKVLDGLQDNHADMLCGPLLSFRCV